MRRTLTNLALAGALALGTGGCGGENYNTLFEGEILRKSYGESSFWNDARYTALVELSFGDTVIVMSRGIKAVENNLYEIGDTVKVDLAISPPQISN